MDFNLFLEKSLKKRSESFNSTLPSLSTASTDSKFGLQDSKNSINDSTCEEMLKEISQSLKQLKESNDLIRGLAQSQTTIKLLENSSKHFILRLPKHKFHYQSLPITAVFRSRRNDINLEIFQIRTMRTRRKTEAFSLTEPIENISTVIHSFESKNIVFRPSGKRVSIHSIGSSPTENVQLVRNRKSSLLNPVLKEILESSSSSESSSEEKSLPKLWVERQALYKTPGCSHYSCLCKGNAEGLSRTDFKKTKSKGSRFVSSAETSNKKVLKFGYLNKRLAKTNKFRTRWVVLTGFKLYWYRSQSSSHFKGLVTLTDTLISQTEAGKERCLSITGQERQFEFLNDKTGSEWKNILNSQIGFKSYLKTFNTLHYELLEYFQDLNTQSLSLKHLSESPEATTSLFKFVSFSLPAHQRLETLELFNCQLDDEIVSTLCGMIQGNCHIKSLLLAKNQLTSQAAGSIASLMKQEEAEFNSIMFLDLSENQKVSDEGVEMLAGALTVRFEQLFFPNNLHQLPIYSLKLNFISMNDRGLLALNKVVVRAQQMMQDEETDLRMSLEISGNSFSSQSFRTFAENLAQFQGISGLNISHCTEIGDQDVIRLVDALGSNFSMTELDLTGIRLSRSGFQQLFTLFNQNCSLRNVRVLIDDEFKIALVEKGLIMKHFSVLC